MKKFNLSIRDVLVALVVATALLSSCADETPSKQDYVGDGETVVTFSFNVSEAATRALLATKEDEINNIQVLAFDKDGYYSYTAYASSITTTSTTSPAGVLTTTATAQVTLAKSQTAGDTYDLVILTNSLTEVGVLGTSDIGSAKNVVLGKLEKSLAGKWPSTTATHPGFPMSSDPELSQLCNLEIDNSLVLPTINLYRSVARINVLIGDLGGKSASENFELTSVRVYNRNTKGYLTGVRETPALPETYTDAPNAHLNCKEEGPLVYEGTEITTETEDGTTIHPSCIKEIYVFEAVNPADAASADRADRPYIVVGGIYTNDARVPDTKETYYRIDFKDYNNDVFLNILRNHSYNFTITSVTGPGSPDPESPIPLDVNLNILGWSEGRIENINIDRYELSVSPIEFTLSAAEYNASSTDNVFTVTTDYPGGWKVDKITYAPGSATGWLSTNPTSANTILPTEVKLIVDENTTSAKRTGYIHLLMGKLTYKVTVVQAAAP